MVLSLRYELGNGRCHTLKEVGDALGVISLLSWNSQLEERVPAAHGAACC